MWWREKRGKGASRANNCFSVSDEEKKPVAGMLVVGEQGPSHPTMKKVRWKDDTPSSVMGRAERDVPGHGSPLMAKIPRGRGAPFPVCMYIRGMGRGRGCEKVDVLGVCEQGWARVCGK